MSRVDVISNERVFDDRHHLHEFRDFWRDGPVALVFLPQFGSAFGLAQARALTSRFDEVEALGAQVILIGIGTSIQGFTFRKRAGSRFPVMVTQDHTLYRTMGLASRRRLLNPIRNATAFINSVRAGIYPYQRTGDPNRLGGVFVVEKGGRRVTWEHRARYAAHLAAGVDVVGALRAAARPVVTA
ncbi:peroxiredoxin-like family protein [Mycobacterium sp. PDNC021]|uniref:peroxiredoxin-like family protein n=1 Tax=Mycobacterium sp. PDNC021 TaxID=3391399 RepID=UPI003AAA35E4